MTLNRWLLTALTSLALLGAGGVSAADSTDWTSLTAAQQKVLAPLAKDWGSIETPRRSKWLEVASKFPSMPKEEQARVQERMADWARMTPSERSRARLQFQEVKQVPASERQAKWEAYQALPEEQRHALAQSAKHNAKAASAPASAAKLAQASGQTEGKRNLVQPSAPTPTRAVTPTSQQAKPGATTTTMTARPQVPAHQQAGLPKIAATPGFVDPSTLLPKRGPQGAAVRSASASAPSEPAAQGQ